MVPMFWKRIHFVACFSHDSDHLMSTRYCDVFTDDAPPKYVTVEPEATLADRIVKWNPSLGLTAPGATKGIV
jgi:hypothetical protein